MKLKITILFIIFSVLVNAQSLQKGIKINRYASPEAYFEDVSSFKGDKDEIWGYLSRFPDREHTFTFFDARSGIRKTIALANKRISISKYGVIFYSNNLDGEIRSDDGARLHKSEVYDKKGNFLFSFSDQENGLISIGAKTFLTSPASLEGQGGPHSLIDYSGNKLSDFTAFIGHYTIWASQENKTLISAGKGYFYTLDQHGSVIHQQERDLPNRLINPWMIYAKDTEQICVSSNRSIHLLDFYGNIQKSIDIPEKTTGNIIAGIKSDGSTVFWADWRYDFETGPRATNCEMVYYSLKHEAVLWRKTIAHPRKWGPVRTGFLGDSEIAYSISTSGEILLFNNMGEIIMDEKLADNHTQLEIRSGYSFLWINNTSNNQILQLDL